MSGLNKSAATTAPAGPGLGGSGYTPSMYQPMIDQSRAQYQADRDIVRGNEQAIRSSLNPVYQQAQPMYYQPQIARNPATGFGNAPVDPRFLSTVASLGQQDQTRFEGVNPMLQHAQQQYAAFGPYTQQVQQGIAGLQQTQRTDAVDAEKAEKARLAEEAAKKAEQERFNRMRYSRYRMFGSGAW